MGVHEALRARNQTVVDRYMPEIHSFMSRHLGPFNLIESYQPRIQFHHKKWLAMDQKEQAEYERKANETKVVYFLVCECAHREEMAIPKLVFEYLKAINRHPVTVRKIERNLR